MLYAGVQDLIILSLGQAKKINKQVRFHSVNYLEAQVMRHSTNQITSNQPLSNQRSDYSKIHVLSYLLKIGR